MVKQDNTNYQEKVEQQLDEILNQINDIINIMKGQNNGNL